MAEVIDINSRLPHIAGQAICLECKYEWQGVAPIGVISLECSSCGLMKGVWRGVAAPDEAWECSCGCLHFFVTQHGAQCCLCGITQQF